MAGEIDIITAPQLSQSLAASAGAGRPVIADLDQVSFIDAAGLRALTAAARQAAAGGSLHVVSARYQVRWIFAHTGLDRQIPLARTRAEALAGLHADGKPALPGRTCPADRGRRQPAGLWPGRRAQRRHKTGKEVTG